MRLINHLYPTLESDGSIGEMDLRDTFEPTEEAERTWGRRRQVKLNVVDMTGMDITVQGDEVFRLETYGFRNKQRNVYVAVFVSDEYKPYTLDDPDRRRLKIREAIEKSAAMVWSYGQRELRKDV